MALVLRLDAKDGRWAHQIVQHVPWVPRAMEMHTDRVTGQKRLPKSAGTIYQRNDGSNPTYTEALTLAEELDVEMGGIRGLTAIDNPTGFGQSLIFMWVPNQETFGQIKRLDPDGNGGFTVHDEVEIGDLINTALESGTARKSVLGAYSEFYPLINPATGMTIHLIG